MPTIRQAANEDPPTRGDPEDPVGNLVLTNRARSALRYLGASTVGDADRVVDEDFARQPNIGKKTRDDARAEIDRYLGRVARSETIAAIIDQAGPMPTFDEPRHADAVAVHADEEPEGPIPGTRRAAIIADWRERMLETATPRRVWFGLAGLYAVTMLVLLLFLARQPLILAIAIAIASLVAWTFWRRLSRHDRHVRSLAMLTPVIDRTILSGQVAVLHSSFQNLLHVIGHPVGAEVRAQAVGVMMSSAGTIMSRGGVTVETATVEGYPPYPEIDRTMLPGSDGDFLQIHLHRIEASMRQIDRALESEVILSESIAQLAGEIVPPLRSVEATLVG